MFNGLVSLDFSENTHLLIEGLKRLSFVVEHQQTIFYSKDLPESFCVLSVILF